MRKAERADTGMAMTDRGARDAHPPLPPVAPIGVPGGPAFSQQTVWYRLMKLTNLINRPFFCRFARAYHLTINDARVLVTLASMPEAAAHELCEATGMHAMNVSRSVATLRRQGRISARRDPANRRRKLLRLTAKGWGVARAFVPDMNRMSDFLFASLSTHEVHELSRLTDLLIARLESVDTAPDAPRAWGGRTGRRTPA